MANYLDVLSNDELSHLALSGSPETLCGKAIADEVQPRDRSVDQHKNPNTDWLVQSLPCDICHTLSSGDSFLKENARIVEAGRECPHCQDGFDPTGNLCWECGGAGWLDGANEDPYSILGIPQDISVENLHGTKVADAYDALRRDREVADWFTANERFATGPADEEEEDEAGNKQKPGGWSKAPLAYNADSNPATPPRKGPHFGDPATKVAAAPTCQACGYLNTSGMSRCPSCGFEGGEAGRIQQTEDRPERYRVEQTDEGPQEVSKTAAEVYYSCPECGHDRLPGYQCQEGYDGNCSCSTCSGLAKTATNWTRDGEPIEEGTVIISTEEAARTPFLDFNRVSVSDRRECPDCLESHWLSKIASCDNCNTMKCVNCMESINAFFGMCKKCASADSDLAYEVSYEDASADQDRYLSYMLRDEGDVEVDSLFLPDSDEV